MPEGRKLFMDEAKLTMFAQWMNKYHFGLNRKTTKFVNFCARFSPCKLTGTIFFKNSSFLGQEQTKKLGPKFSKLKKKSKKMTRVLRFDLFD